MPCTAATLLSFKGITFPLTLCDFVLGETRKLMHSFYAALRPFNSASLGSVGAIPSRYLFADSDAGEATSFWKRGSFRSGSNIGSSGSSAVHLPPCRELLQPDVTGFASGSIVKDPYTGKLFLVP
jgi:hypothetical protein